MPLSKLNVSRRHPIDRGRSRPHRGNRVRLFAASYQLPKPAMRTSDILSCKTCLAILVSVVLVAPGVAIAETPEADALFQGAIARRASIGSLRATLIERGPVVFGTEREAEEQRIFDVDQAGSNVRMHTEMSGRNPATEILVDGRLIAYERSEHSDIRLVSPKMLRSQVGSFCFDLRCLGLTGFPQGRFALESYTTLAEEIDLQNVGVESLDGVDAWHLVGERKESDDSATIFEYWITEPGFQVLRHETTGTGYPFREVVTNTYADQSDILPSSSHIEKVSGPDSIVRTDMTYEITDLVIDPTVAKDRFTVESIDAVDGTPIVDYDARTTIGYWKPTGVSEESDRIAPPMEKDTPARDPDAVGFWPIAFGGTALLVVAGALLWLRRR